MPLSAHSRPLILYYIHPYTNVLFNRYYCLPFWHQFPGHSYTTPLLTSIVQHRVSRPLLCPPYTSPIALLTPPSSRGLHGLFAPIWDRCTPPALYSGTMCSFWGFYITHILLLGVLRFSRTIFFFSFVGATQPSPPFFLWVLCNPLLLWFGYLVTL
jgi:hypothetical protein